MKKDGRLHDSFRDPAGFMFWQEGLLYRQINRYYERNYNQLIDSGLYNQLVEKGLLVPHVEAPIELAQTPTAYKIIRPELLPFISYPYEWCFGQLKAAALTTLAIQKNALEYGMSLKDSSAYNIQFKGNAPMFIDTLSFEEYSEGRPWVAYRQFCQFFLAPLALMSFTDIRLSKLLQVHLDGIPLDLATKLLPVRSLFNISLLIHIFLHSKSQQYFSTESHVGHIGNKKSISKNSLLGLLDSLESAIKKLSWKADGGTWGNYYQTHNYDAESFDHKKDIVSKFLQESAPRDVWDIGANTGEFSRLAVENNASLVVSWDLDPSCVEKNYNQLEKEKNSEIIPLVLDLNNPSPSLGWSHRERMSLISRGPADTVLALAVFHHLAIGNNVPVDQIAEFFAAICKRWLIIEFVPKDDPMVQKLLSSREDIFDQYTPQMFEQSFNKYFLIKQSRKIKKTKRILYLMASRR